MGANRIKSINKKWRHEQRRKKRRVQLRSERESAKVRNNRMRKMFAEGKREMQAKRRAEKSYVDNLAQEVLSEQ